MNVTIVTSLPTCINANKYRRFSGNEVKTNIVTNLKRSLPNDFGNEVKMHGNEVKTNIVTMQKLDNTRLKAIGNDGNDGNVLLLPYSKTQRVCLRCSIKTKTNCRLCAAWVNAQYPSDARLRFTDKNRDEFLRASYA